MSCGAVHSQARGMVTQGYTATLVAATLAISRSSLYYRKRPRGSRADRPVRRTDRGGLRRKNPRTDIVAWPGGYDEGKSSGESQAVLRVMRGAWVAGAFAASASTKEERVGPRRKQPSRIRSGNPDMTKIWAGPSVGWVYLVCVIDCCTREIVGLESLASLPDRRRADSGGTGCARTAAPRAAAKQS